MSVVVCWLRKALRLHDNPALLAASRDAVASQQPLLVCFLADANLVAAVGRPRRRFLMQALVDLDTRLRAVQSRLAVFSTGDLLASRERELEFECVDNLDRSAASMAAAAAFVSLVETLKVSAVHFELCSEPYGSQRDRAVIATLSKRKIPVKRWASATLVDPRHMARVASQSAPLTYQRFQTLFDQCGGAAAPLPAPTQLAPPPAALFADDRHSPAVAGAPIILADGPLRSDEQTFLVGGETAGLARLADMTRDAAWVGRFEKPKSSPYALKPASTTQLSPYLKFGCVSPRLAFARLRECEALCKSPSQPPVSLVGQLLWREHFMLAAAAVGPRFGQIEGNPVCRQIPWSDNEALFAAWRDGRTGYPAIDAAMRQLRQQGWLHHLARHHVACFATRGDLWLPWPKVAAVFDELLLDGDFALNNANWMWLSASAFFHQFGRVYSPVAFARQYGAEACAYVRKFVPEVAHLSDKHILEPWTAPSDVQQRLYQTYPRRVVDHDVVRQENLDKMGAAFKNDALKARNTVTVPFYRPYDDACDTAAEIASLLSSVSGASSSSSSSSTASASASTASSRTASERPTTKKARTK